MWWIPALVFVATFGAGIMACARWLPEPAPGPVGGMAFFAVSGLVGAGAGLLGLHVYLIVRELESASGSGLFDSKGDALAGGLASMLFDAGLVFAAAAAVYLLAPEAEDTQDLAERPDGQG
ncbi:MAG TPA: hypothetical protein VN618_11525 [Solirubrobacteraceae bacterium]|nr:hypothetical protein [Solirubrobacteraceae bacterium]